MVENGQSPYIEVYLCASGALGRFDLNMDVKYMALGIDSVHSWDVNWKISLPN